LFVNAYLADPGKTKAYYSLALQKCAKNMNLNAIFDCLNQDSRFANALSSVLGGRISMICSAMKKITLNMVQTVYNLGVGEACQKRVMELLLNSTYIFPTIKDGALIKRTKPFFHPAIISTLQQVFAKNVAEKYSDCFTSSISAGPRHDEKEMPIAITAFIATCYHASLDEYHMGAFIAIDFNADQYEDVYIGHVKTLINIREGNPDAFHRLMADLFQEVLQNTTARTINVSEGAMVLLDLAGMDV